MTAPPSDMPERTKCNTLPICSGGAASLTMTSRGGAACAGGYSGNQEHHRSGDYGQGYDKRQMSLAAVGDPASEQHACDHADRVSGQRRRRCDRQPVNLMQDRDQPGSDAGAGHRRCHEKRKEHHYRARQQQLGADGVGLPRAERSATLARQDAALPDNRRYDRQPERADRYQCATPAQCQYQRRSRRRVSGKPDVSNKGVKRGLPAEPRPLYRAAKHRVISRVDHRVAELRQRGGPRNLPIRCGEPPRRDREGHQEGAADQQRPTPYGSTRSPIGVCIEQRNRLPTLRVTGWQRHVREGSSPARRPPDERLG